MIIYINLQENPFCLFVYYLLESFAWTIPRLISFLIIEFFIKKNGCKNVIDSKPFLTRSWNLKPTIKGVGGSTFHNIFILLSFFFVLFYKIFFIHPCTSKVILVQPKNTKRNWNSTQRCIERGADRTIRITISYTFY